MAKTNINSTDGDGNTSFSGDNNKVNNTYKKYNKLPKWVYWVWLIAIVAIGLSLASFFCHIAPNTKWHVEAVSVGIVLTFVGLLATFVVVSNYVQLKNTEDKVDGYKKDWIGFKSNFKELKSEIDSISERVIQLEKEIKTQNTINKKITDDLTNNISELKEETPKHYKSIAEIGKQQMDFIEKITKPMQPFVNMNEKIEKQQREFMEIVKNMNEKIEKQQREFMEIVKKSMQPIKNRKINNNKISTK